MTRLSSKQDLNVLVLASADTRWRDSRRNLEMEVRREVKERGRHLLDARNDAALIALESGVPKTQIAALGLHTKNRATVDDALSDAAERRRLREIATPPRFARGEGEGEVEIHLSGAELSEACARAGWTVAEAIDARAHRAIFRVMEAGNGSSTIAIAVTPTVVPGHDKAHPIVAWGRAHSAEIIAWDRGPTM